MNQLHVPVSVNDRVRNKVAPNSPDLVTLQGAFKSLSLDVESIAHHVLEGHAFCPAHLATDRDGRSIRRNNAFEQAQLIFLDIDNSVSAPGELKRQKIEAEGYLSFDRVAEDPWCQKNLFLLYTTPSHTPDWHRFRMVFCLPKPITSAIQYGEIIRAFVERFEADPACKSIVHLYYGNTEAEVRPFGNVLSPEFVAATLDRKKRLPREVKAVEPRVNDNITADVCREILAAIPPQLDYIDWVKVVSGVASHFDETTAERLINEWSPGKAGEVAYKIKHRLRQITFGTVIYIARSHGWTDPNAVVIARRGRPKAEDIPDDAFSRTAWGLNDAGNRDRLVDDFDGQLLYDCAAKKWRLFDGKRFVEDTLSNVTARAIARFRKIEREADDVEHPGIAQAIRNHAKKSLSRAAVDNALNLASRGTSLVRMPSDFDQDPWLLNLRNCVFNLKTFELHEHSPSFMQTRMIDIDFDENAECPKWEAFLEQIFEGDQQMIEFVQRSVGYSLSGLVDEQYFWFCYGTGANGKSVFFNVLQMIMGEYYHKSPVEMLLLAHNKGGEKSSNDLAATVGKRFLVTDEFPKGRKLDLERIKNLTGDDLITARFLFQEYFSFKSSAKLWIYGNNYPDTSTRDDAFWRRVFIIPFAVTIPEPDRIPMSVLMEGFRSEAAGILRWAIDGFHTYKTEKDRLAIPDKVLIAREKLKEETDVLGPFIEETVVDAPASTTLPSTELYKLYVEWAKAGNEFVFSKKKFTQMLIERKWKTMKTRKDITCFIGKALSANARPADGMF